MHSFFGFGVGVKKTFYVTTPIYYVNAKPHLGSLYSTLIADVIARWQMLKGEKTFFLTGTDEHGQKVAQAAHQAGKSPQEFVDSIIPAFKSVWERYDIAYNIFMRTTLASHKQGAQQLVAQLLKQGDVYKSLYEGWYCVSCETFVTNKDITDTDTVLCTTCGRPTTHVAEETYFFKLSAYQEKLLQWYKDNPHFITPKERSHEIINFVESGLKDISISRTTVPWGVPFPDDSVHTIYVWVEALCNYITAIGYGDSAKQQEFNTIWPADVHVVGKDIIRFHAVYWPALLMAAGLALPKRFLVHGWITVDKQKMSKSLGNVIDPITLCDEYGVDPVRYFLLKHIPITQDGNFSYADLEQCITSELANNLGNLLNRMVMLAEKNNSMSIDAPQQFSPEALKVHAACIDMMHTYDRHMQDYYFHLALNEILHFLHIVNAYFHANEPWKLAKTNMPAFKEVLSVVAHSLRAVAFYIMPVMPEKMRELLQGLGITYTQDTDIFETLRLDNWNQPFTLVTLLPLFTKPDTLMNDEKTVSSIAQQTTQEPVHESTIEFSDWAKVVLRIGTITSAEPVDNSDKLLRMQVDFGTFGLRQILAGIKPFCAIEDIVGTQTVFVYNLKPRKMAGLESQGMLLAGKDEKGAPTIIRPISTVPNGTQLQ